jgi:hypothetical protein
MFINHLRSKFMQNKKVIIIASVSVLCLGLLYFGYKKTRKEDIRNNPQLKADFEAVMKKIDEAKK